LLTSGDNVPTVATDFAFAYFNAWISEQPYGVLLYAIVSNNNNAVAHVIVTSPYAAFSTVSVSIQPNSIFKVRKYFKIVLELLAKVWLHHNSKYQPKWHFCVSPFPT
jgi:hypothetical protein